MKQFVLEPPFDPPVTEIDGFRSRSDGGKAEHVRAAMLL